MFVVVTVDVEDLAAKLVADLREQPLHRREPPAQRAGLDLEVQLHAAQRACLRLQDIPAQILRPEDTHGDALPQLRNRAARLDIASAIPAVLAYGRHDDDLLE